MQKAGLTNHSSFLVLLSGLWLCIWPFSIWWQTNEQTTNHHQVTLVQACSWLVRRLSFAKKENMCRPTHRCFAFVSHLNTLKVILSHTQTICHIWTPELFFVTFEHLKASFVTRKCTKCDIVWNVTRHLALQILRLENRGRQLTICIMSLPPRKPNLKYQE